MASERQKTAKFFHHKIHQMASKYTKWRQDAKVFSPQNTPKRCEYHVIIFCLSLIYFFYGLTKMMVYFLCLTLSEVNDCVKTLVQNVNLHTSPVQNNPRPVQSPRANWVKKKKETPLKKRLRLFFYFKSEGRRRRKAVHP